MQFTFFIRVGWLSKPEERYYFRSFWHSGQKYTLPPM
jgi:hypothetical protein